MSRGLGDVYKRQGLSVVMIGRRENLEELNNALTNIHNIDKIK